MLKVRAERPNIMFVRIVIQELLRQEESRCPEFVMQDLRIQTAGQSLMFG